MRPMEQVESPRRLDPVSPLALPGRFNRRPSLADFPIFKIPAAIFSLVRFFVFPIFETSPLPAGGREWLWRVDIRTR